MLDVFHTFFIEDESFVESVCLRGGGGEKRYGL